MNKFIMFASVVAFCNANGYSDGYGGGYGGNGYSNGYSSGYSSGGYGNGYGSGNNYGYSSDSYGGGYSQSSHGPISAAITSRRQVDIRPVSLHQDPIYPQILEVAPLELPIQIIYNSKSSPVLVHQNHIPGAKGQVEKTSSEEEPHKVMHQVLRPVIQEVREVITPYRRVVQEIQPVIESVNTIIAKGERAQGANYVSPVSQQSGGGIDGGNGVDNYGLDIGYQSSKAAKKA